MQKYFQFQNENTQSWDNALKVIMEHEPTPRRSPVRAQETMNPKSKSFSTSSDLTESQSVTSDSSDVNHAK